MTYIMEFLVHPERRSDQGNIIRMFPMWNSCRSEDLSARLESSAWTSEQGTGRTVQCGFLSFGGETTRVLAQ